MEKTTLPVEKVDIVVSEWMGYFLLFEGMLDSFIYARDMYLKPGGLILPNRCNISITGICDLGKNCVPLYLLSCKIFSVKYVGQGKKITRYTVQFQMQYAPVSKFESDFWEQRLRNRKKKSVSEHLSVTVYLFI